MQEEQRVSRLAVASAIVGLLFFLPVVSALAAITLGIFALYNIKDSKDLLAGSDYAVLGIVLGTLQMTAIIIILIFVTFFSFGIRVRDDLHKADSYKLRGRNAEALAHYKKALKKLPPDSVDTVNPQAFRIYHDLGVISQNIADNKGALEYYSKSLDMARKEKAFARYGIGSIYMHEGRYKEALEEFDKAIELNSHMYDAHQNRAVNFRNWGRYEESVDACKKTIGLFPDSVKTYCSLGWAYEKMGKFKEAIEAHIKAVRLDSKWGFPKERISYCFTQLKDKGVASKLLEELKEADPVLAKNISGKYLED